MELLLRLVGEVGRPAAGVECSAAVAGSSAGVDDSVADGLDDERLPVVPEAARRARSLSSICCQRYGGVGEVDAAQAGFDDVGAQADDEGGHVVAREGRRLKRAAHRLEQSEVAHADGARQTEVRVQGLRADVEEEDGE